MSELSDTAEVFRASIELLKSRCSPDVVELACLAETIEDMPEEQLRLVMSAILALAATFVGSMSKAVNTAPAELVDAAGAHCIRLAELHFLESSWEA